MTTSYAVAHREVLRADVRQNARQWSPGDAARTPQKGQSAGLPAVAAAAAGAEAEAKVGDESGDEAGAVSGLGLRMRRRCGDVSSGTAVGSRRQRVRRQSAPRSNGPVSDPVIANL